MRVAIIASPYPLEEAPAPPLGVTYVAAAFEAAGAEVRIFDYLVSRYSPEKLAADLDDFRPDLVGAGSVTLNFPRAARIIEDVKRLRPSIVTAMGGPHVSFDVENTLRTYPGIDLLVVGEGEQTAMELAPAIRDRSAWPRIRGLAFRDGDRIVRTEPRELIEDPDSVPLPARHLLPVSRYLALGFPVSIITSRGCPHPCIFCQGRRMIGSKVRYRKPVKVVDEIEEILSYGFPRINFADDLFLSKQEHARAVCREILRRGLKFGWSAFSRVNTVDLETFRLMREAGCDAVSFGMESGNQEMLKRLRKGITLEQGRRAVAICKEVGILAHASFMAGLPGETLETLKETQAFADGLDIIYGFHILAPFPGTTIRDEVDKYDLEILTSDWSRYDANQAVVRTSQLAAEDIEKFVHDFEKSWFEAWQEMVDRYNRGTSANPEEWLRVYGHYRMELTYRLFADDLLEEHGRFPLNGMPDASSWQDDTALVDKVAELTGFEHKLVSETLKDFIGKGFIKARKEDQHLRWFWTHNRWMDFGPFAGR
ncbi:MAG: radical SAM protein [bacterium]